MAGIVLFQGGAEKLLPHSRRLGGFWPSHEELPSGYAGFPDVLCPDKLNLPYGNLVELGWPCWFYVTCLELHRWCSGQPIEGSEMLAAFHSAMRITGLLGLPVDYAQAKDRYMLKILRLRAELPPETPTLKVVALLEARMRGEPYGYELAKEMISAYRDADRVYDELKRVGCGDIYETAVVSAKVAFGFMKADDLTLSILNACFDKAYKQLQREGKPTDMGAISDREDVVVAPYVMRARLMLLESLRESRVEGPGQAPEVRTGCEGRECERCFEEFWLELLEDMTTTQRRTIERERAQADMHYNWWERYNYGTEAV